ncbi:hypothetical protein AA313_de0202490 [Arthrobotrys entomopaga]|nr:hypothetical protein AA313_de0202490 [Arthrobotrys entomopaga]
MWAYINANLQPLLTLLTLHPVPFTYRWRYFAFSPAMILINSLKYLPWLFSTAYTTHYIPSTHGTHSIRFIVFQPKYTPSSPSKTKPRPLHITIHGGAFLPGLAEQNADLAHRVCRETGAVTVSVQYRGAPRYTFPASHDDVDDVFSYLFSPAAVKKLNLDLNNITVSGLSAGVNLSMASSMRYPGKIKAAISYCGVVDFRIPPWEKPKPAGFPTQDPLKFMLPVFDSYAGPEREKYMNDPRLHIILASVDKLPTNILFLVPMMDILLDEEIQLIDRLRKETEGTERRIESVFYEGEYHGFPERK